MAVCCTCLGSARFKQVFDCKSNKKALTSFVNKLAIKANQGVKEVTRDGVVQKEPKEASDKHTGGQQHLQYLVQLHHASTWKHMRHP